MVTISQAVFLSLVFCITSSAIDFGDEIVDELYSAAAAADQLSEDYEQLDDEYDYGALSDEADGLLAQYTALQEEEDALRAMMDELDEEYTASDAQSDMYGDDGYEAFSDDVYDGDVDGEYAELEAMLSDIDDEYDRAELDSSVKNKYERLMAQFSALQEDDEDADVYAYEYDDAYQNDADDYGDYDYDALSALDAVIDELDEESMHDRDVIDDYDEADEFVEQVDGLDELDDELNSALNEMFMSGYQKGIAIAVKKIKSAKSYRYQH